MMSTKPSLSGGIDVHSMHTRRRGFMRRNSPLLVEAFAAARTRPRVCGQPFLCFCAALGVLGFVCAAAGEMQRLRDVKQEVDDVLRLIPNPVRGSELFSYCAACHGAQAHGLPEGWVPQIGGQHPRYLVKELLDYRRSARWDARMEPIAKGHALRNAQDIADIVSFLGAQVPEGGQATDDSSASPEVTRFYQIQCSRCHGKSGIGDNARLVPRIAGQNFGYLLRQMHDVVDGRRPNMRRQHFKALADLNVQELVGLARYVSHLGANDKETVTAGLTSFAERAGGGSRTPGSVE